ncbi:hypothetical protein CVU75_02995 [Candidatus Dependentiae bacterium HGW-Dependentiae-1]|nr:MAG: hypothetical protein CVU75_02995 [Candidatus Dependentiae bacterium HGW-Dependentiae-1]
MFFFVLSIFLLTSSNALHAMEFECLNDACNKPYASVNGVESFGEWQHLRDLIVTLVATQKSEQERLCCCFPWKRNVEVLDLLADIQSDIDHDGFPSLARDWLSTHRDGLQKRQRVFCCCNKICLGGCGGFGAGVGASIGMSFLVPNVAASSVVLGCTVCGMCTGAYMSYGRIKNPTLERMLIIKPRHYVMPYNFPEGKPVFSVKVDKDDV